MQLRELIQELELVWPTTDAESWDRPGLMVGNLDNTVSKVLFSVDAVETVIDQALNEQCDLLITHHPMFLRGIHEVSESNFKGRNAAKAIRGGLAIYSAHTNADFQPEGVTNSLAKALGLTNLQALDDQFGHGAVGELSQELSLLDFARRVSKAIPAVAAGVKVAGDPALRVKRVGVLAGAGDSYLNLALSSDIDVFITSDLRHHPSQDFREQSKITGDCALIDISHWAAEWVWLNSAADTLRTRFPDLEIIVSDINTDPWTFAVMQ